MPKLGTFGLFRLLAIGYLCFVGISACVTQPVAEKRAIEAGPIWNQADAEIKCPKVAKENNGIWTGQWWTTIEGKMSVCQIQ